MWARADDLIAWAACLVLLACLVFAFTSPSRAHSWYDPACCSGIDCKPVPDGVVEEHKDGLYVQGYGILSYADPRVRQSRDWQTHLCVSPSGKLLCVYRKPGGV